mgnify:CR=1 FL=1
MSVFTGTHYAVVQMQKERILPKGDDYTTEESFEALYTFCALAGTYTITGNTVTMERLGSSRPEGVGGAAIQEFTVEGDTLNLRGVSCLRSGEMNWHRIS